jgi:hypothetical protein
MYITDKINADFSFIVERHICQEKAGSRLVSVLILHTLAVKLTFRGGTFLFFPEKKGSKNFSFLKKGK